MRLLGDRRGQSIQIGAVLLFGVLIIFLSTYQAVVVPNQNSGVEAGHQQTIEQQMQELRNAIVSTTGGRSDSSVTVTLGTDYPARVFALNPPPATGALRTVGTQDGAINLTVGNANATDSESGDFWNGTEQSYNTGALAYRPDYNEYSAPEFVYENTVLYRQFDASRLGVTGQRLVDGKRLSLAVLDGTYQRESSGTVTLDVESVSTSETTVGVTNETDENVTVSFASQRNASEWRELFRDDGQFTDQSGHVVRGGVSEAPIPGSAFDRISVELERGVTYQLRMAKVGVGSGSTDENAAYVTVIDRPDRTVFAGSSHEMTVEVRDRFNNPVSGVRVNATATAGGFDDPAVTTAEGGRATFTYDAPGSPTTGVSLDFEMGDGGSAEERAEFGLDVVSPGEGGEGNGSQSAYSVSWYDPSRTGDNPSPNWVFPRCSATECVYDAGNDTVDDNVTLRAGASIDAEGLNVDFGSDDATIGILDPGENTTGSDANATTVFAASDTGTAAVYAVSGGSTARIDLSVVTTPVADASASDSAVDNGSSGTLDGSLSSDPIGEITAYEWSIVGDSYGATINDGDTATPEVTFDATSATVDQDRDVTVELTVTDDEGRSNATATTVTIREADNDPTAIQFNNFQGFTADAKTDSFTLEQIDVQDADNDDDLDRVEYEVTDSGDSVVASETVTGIGPAQYQAQQPAINITGAEIQPGETYTLTGTVYDADGNFDSRNLQDTPSGFASLSAEVTNTRTGGPGGETEATEVTFTYDISPAADGVEFTVDENDGSGPETTESATGDGSDSPFALQFGGGGQPSNNFALVVTADIQGGGCKMATLTDSQDVAELADDDWNDC